MPSLVQVGIAEKTRFPRKESILWLAENPSYDRNPKILVSNKVEVLKPKMRSTNFKIRPPGSGSLDSSGPYNIPKW